MGALWILDVSTGRTEAHELFRQREMRAFFTRLQQLLYSNRLELRRQMPTAMPCPVRVRSLKLQAATAQSAVLVA
jgi:hypothetical protein